MRVDNPEECIEAVKAGKVNDPVVRFHLRADFECIGVLMDYLPSDKESMGYATDMVWHNPYADEELESPDAPQTLKEAVRVATVQFQQRKIGSFKEFMANVEYFVEVVTDYRCDFVVFPELFTLQLLAFEERKLGLSEALEALTEFTPRFTAAMRKLAISYNINIIGGSHPTRTEDGDIQNVAYLPARRTCACAGKDSSDAKRTLLVEYQGR
jgi:hypothetical protein